MKEKFEKFYPLETGGAFRVAYGLWNDKPSLDLRFFTKAYGDVWKPTKAGVRIYDVRVLPEIATDIAVVWNQWKEDYPEEEKA